jgi:hypothetical protein
MMVDEMRRYAATAGTPRPPQSVRLSAHAAAQAALAPADGSCGDALGGTAGPMELDEADAVGASGAGAVPAQRPAAAAGVAPASTDALLAALTSQLSALRSDLLSAVDAKLERLEARVNAKLLEGRGGSGGGGGGTHSAGAPTRTQ